MRLALAFVLLAVAAPAASAGVHTVERPLEWTRPSGTFAASHLTAKTRRVRIQVVSGGCFTYKRAEASRTRDSVVITAIFDSLESDDGYTTVPCPSGIARVETVSLNGRLGSRAIEDGSTLPATPRYTGHGRAGIPDAIGTIADTYNRARGYGFRVAISDPFESLHRCDARVIEQVPEAGARRRRGTVVRFTAVGCAQGSPIFSSQTYTVPDVVGARPSSVLLLFGGIDVDQHYAALPPSYRRSFDANYRVLTQSVAPGTEWHQGDPPVSITLG